MAPRKKAATPAAKDVQEETAITPVTQIEKPLVLEGDPEAQLAFAQKAAKALMSVVSQKAKPVIINNKQYLEYGDWQVLARFYGATVEVEWTRLLKDDEGKTLKYNNRNMGFEARVLVKRHGEVISSAEGMCTRDEMNRSGKPSIWATSPDFAVRSMAQTRTAAKALRNAFGWVAELSGYSSTPAEEMDFMATLPPRDMAPSRPVAPVKDVSFKTKIVFLLKELGSDPSSMTAEEVDAKIQEYTSIPLEPHNYRSIVMALEECVKSRQKYDSELADEFRDIPE